MALFGPSDDALYELASAMRSQASAVSAQTVAIVQLTAEVRELRKTLKRPRRPGLLKLRITGEKAQDGMDKLQFLIDVPGEATPTDVVSREATVTVGDQLPQSSEVAGSAEAHLGPFEAEEGAAVSVSVVNIDNAGNRSEARVASFVLADTIAPAAPGEIGLRVVGETPAAPAEDPAPEQPSE